MDILDDLVAGTPPAQPEPTPQPNPFVDAVRAVDQQDTEALRASVLGAQISTPDTVAKAARLAGQTGLPVDVVERNLPAVEARTQIDGLDATLSGAPSTRQWLGDPTNAKIAKDDVPRLSWLERNLSFAYLNPVQLLAGGALDQIGKLLGKTPARPPDGEYERLPLWEQDLTNLWRGALGVYSTVRTLEANSAASRLTSEPKPDFEVVDPRTSVSEPVYMDWVRMRPRSAAGRAYMREEAAKRLVESTAEVARLQERIAALPQSSAAKAFTESKSAVEAFDRFWADPKGIVRALGLQSLPQMVPAMAAGTFSGPVGVAAVMGMSSFAGEYASGLLQMIGESGVDISDPKALAAAFQNPALMDKIREASAIKGGIVGTFDTLTTLLGFRTLAPSKMFGRALTPALREGVNIPAQLAVQMAGGGLGEAVGSYVSDQAIEPGQVGAEIVGELSTLPFDIGRFLWRFGRRGGMQVPRPAVHPAVATAIHENESFNAWADEAAQSKTLQLAPDRFAQLVESVAPDAKVYLPVDKVIEHLRSLPQDQLEETVRSWGIGKQILEAAATGGDVVMPLSAYAQHVIGGQAHEVFQSDLRHSPGGMSLNEAEAYRRFVAQQQQDEGQRPAAEPTPYERIRADVAQRLREVGESDLSIELNAPYIAHRAVTRAQRRPGVDAWELWQREAPVFQRVIPETLARMSPEQLDAVVEEWRKSGAPPSESSAPQGPSLLHFISRKGGVIDDAGALRAMDADTWHHDKPGVQSLVHEQATHSLQDMAHAAWERGYFPEHAERPTGHDLLNAVREELAGRERYPATRQGDARPIAHADHAEALRALDETLTHAGIGTQHLTADIKAALAHTGGRAHAARAIDRILADIAAGRPVDSKPRPIGAVSPWLVGLAKAHGIDIAGRSHAVAPDAIRDALAGRKDSAADLPRGPRALTEADIRAIPDILETPDRVYFRRNDKSGVDVIGYTKRMPDGTVVALEQHHPDREKLPTSAMSGFTAVLLPETTASDPLLYVRNADGTHKVVTPPPESSAIDYGRAAPEMLARLSPQQMDGLIETWHGGKAHSYHAEALAVLDKAMSRFGISPHHTVAEIKATLALYKKAAGGYAQADHTRAVKIIDELLDEERKATGNSFDRKFRTIGYVSPYIIEQAKARGFDVADYTHAVGIDGLRHILAHGNAATEGKYGQRAVTDADILAIPNILEAPDHLYFGIKSKNPKKTGFDHIGYLKQMPNGAVLLFEERYSGERALLALRMVAWDKMPKPESIELALRHNAQGSPGAIQMVPPPPGTSAIEYGRVMPYAWTRLSDSEKDGLIEFWRNGGVSPADKAERRAQGRVVHALDTLLPTLGISKDSTNDEIRAALAKLSGHPQADGAGAVRGRIAFIDGEAIISLFESANFSTVIHELGHKNLEELKADAALPDAPQRIKDDWAIAADWLGVKPGEAITDAQHEKWARGTEVYVREGRAPSLELAAIFRRFKTFLMEIYRTLDELNAPINDDIRGVMDRLFATDEQIALARSRMQAQPIFTNAEQMGVGDSRYVHYTEMTERARSSADAALLQAAMEPIRRRRTEVWNEEAAQVRADVAPRVDRRADLNALHYLSHGTTLDGESLGGRMRLSRGALIDMYGHALVLDALPRSSPPIHVEQGGVHPDVLAEALGFDSGREMLDALLVLEAQARQMKAAGDHRSVREAAIDAEVERVMTERHGDVLSDGSIQREAEDALHNQDQLQLLGIELDALARKAGVEAPPLAVIRRYAAHQIAGRPPHEAADIALHRRAEARAGKAARAALEAGDHAEAFREKQKQIVAHALYIEANAARSSLEAGQLLLDRYAYARTVAGMDQAYLDQIHGLLQPSDGTRASLEQFVAGLKRQGIDVAIPQSLLDGTQRRAPADLTLGEFQELCDAVRQLARLGRR